MMMRRTEKATPFQRGMRVFLFACFVSLGSALAFSLFSSGLPIGARIVASLVMISISLAGGWLVRGRANPKTPTEDTILVRWGSPPPSGVTTALFLYAASVLVAFFTLLTALAFTPSGFLQSSFFDALPGFDLFIAPLRLVAALAALVVQWVIVILSGLTVLFGGLGTRSTYYDIVDFQTKYAEPVHYDRLDYARRGKLVAGYRFGRVIEESGPRPAAGDAVEHFTYEKLVGKKGPYIIDPLAESNPHIGATGGSGQGKTVLLDVLIVLGWLAWKMPSLCIDWLGTHAKLYRAIGGLVLDVPDNFRLNPLMLGKGSGPETRAREIVEAMRFGSEAGVTAFQSGVFRRIIIRAYEEALIFQSDRSTWTRKAPTWQDLIRIVEGNLKAGEYEGNLKESVLSIREKLYLIEPLVGDEPAILWDIVKKIPTCLNMKPLMTADSQKAVVTYHVLQRIYHEFFIQRLEQAGPFLETITIIDEAHLLLGQKEVDTGTTKQESLLLHLIRLGRQFGSMIVFASQLMTDIPEEFAGNAATFIAFLHGSDAQRNLTIKQFDLSKPEVKMYKRLPLGGCFVRRMGQDYADLVKIQMLSDEEIEAARELSESIQLPQLPQPKPEPPPRAARIDASKRKQHEEKETPTAPTLRHCASCQRELKPEARFCDKCGTPQPRAAPTKPETTPTAPAKSSPAVPAESASEGGGEEEPPELSSDETRVHRALLIDPLNMRGLLEKFPLIHYREMLKILHALQDLKLVRMERVPDFEGNNIPHYGALLAKYQSLGIMHEVMLRMIADATVSQGPILNRQSRPDAPDVGWSKSAPKTAGEVETGLKNLTPAELPQWGKHAKERAAKDGYERLVVFVPSVGIQKDYEETCRKPGLFLTTMENALQLLRNLGLQPEPPHKTEQTRTEAEGKSSENHLVEYLKRIDEKSDDETDGKPNQNGASE